MDLSVSPLVISLALVGIVIVVAALLSGLVERSGVPQVAALDRAKPRVPGRHAS